MGIRKLKPKTFLMICRTDYVLKEKVRFEFYFIEENEKTAEGAGRGDTEVIDYPAKASGSINSYNQHRPRVARAHSNADIALRCLSPIEAKEVEAEGKNASEIAAAATASFAVTIAIKAKTAEE